MPKKEKGGKPKIKETKIVSKCESTKENKENTKRKLNYNDETKEKEELTHCIVCNKSFEGHWIQCQTCKG